MTEWVLVNGSRIKRSFLEADVAEAREYVWKKARWELEEHGHCMVCAIAVSPEDPGHRSACGWLCPYCFARFLNSDA